MELDIFYDVYGILHHPEYRAKYAENLKRELPRIPLVDRAILRSEATKNPGIGQNPKTGILRSVQNDSAEEPQHDNDVFGAFANAGKELARLHIDYEKLEPWPLKFIETSSGVLGADVAASLPRHGGVKPPPQR